MKVLQVHNLHRASGGALHVLEHEAEWLSSGGHIVEQLFESSADDSGLGPVAMGLAATWNRSTMRRLEAQMVAFAPDVVHVHEVYPLVSPAVFRVARRRGAATVTTMHGYRFSCAGGLCHRDGRPCEDCVGSALKLHGIRHRCYHDSYAATAALTLSLAAHRAFGTFSSHVDRYIALTEFGRDLLVRDGFPADKIVVKPNSVPDRGHPIAFGDREDFALFIGRLVEEKGVRTMLEAWRLLPHPIPLFIAGDGPLEDLVRAEAERNPAIRPLGWCDADTVAQLQTRAAFLLIPSEWYEAAPLVTLQAFAAGTPVLASDLRNICESLVANGAGRSFRTRDPQALAQAAAAMADDAEGREAMGRRARELYDREHTPERALAALEEIYAAARAARVGLPADHAERT